MIEPVTFCMASVCPLMGFDHVVGGGGFLATGLDQQKPQNVVVESRRGRMDHTTSGGGGRAIPFFNAPFCKGSFCAKKMTTARRLKCFSP